MNRNIPPRNLFIGLWLVLIMIMFAMWGLARWQAASAGTPLILALAVTQMLLVLTFFMRLRDSTRLVRLVAGGGFCWLLFLFILALADYLTRQWH